MGLVETDDELEFGKYGVTGMIQRWLLLSGAIITEVAGTLMLRATVDHPGWIPAVVVCYAASFVFLGLTLRAGMKVGPLYSIWGAAGVAIVASLGAVFFGEMLSVTAIIGIGVIILGVVLVEAGSGDELTPEPTAEAAP